MADDPFVDPAFPDRPTHVDFYALMEAVNFFDGESVEGERSPETLLGEYLDPGSATYMAVQRALRMSEVTGLPVQPLASMWLEGLAVGLRVARERH